MPEKDELSEPQKDMIFNNNTCPDCGQVGFLKGPQGGLSTNIKCKHCGSEFNVCAPFFAERIIPIKEVRRDIKNLAQVIHDGVKVANNKTAKGPRIRLSLSLAEILSLWSMLWLGKMFTRPDDRKNVEAILGRIREGLARLGCPREETEKLTL